MALVDVTLPDIGDYKNVDVIEILVKPGDKISKEQALLALETDKATMEIPSSHAGIVKELLIKAGDKVSQGSLILRLELAENIAVDTTATIAPVAGTETRETIQNPEKAVLPATPPSLSANSNQSVPSTAPSDSYVHAGPAVRQFARELEIDLSKITGTGLKGRISREDLAAFVKNQLNHSGTSTAFALPADPVVDFADFGTVRIEKLPRIKKISGAALSRNAIRIPHITLFDEADITEMENFRNNKKTEAEKKGLKLTPVSFLVKAVAKALKNHPIVNASLSHDGESLIFKEYIHVGVAVDTPNGLMVPVIRNADQKGLYDIAADLINFSKRAREGKLKPDEMKGGCFTISSLGAIGTTGFTPIVNMPEAGILGVSKSELKPKWNGSTFLPRLMLPLSLSLDHRVVDGADGARFLACLVQNLSDLRELIL